MNCARIAAATLLAVGAIAGTASARRQDIAAQLDRIFSDPILARALVGVRIESLDDRLDSDARVIYRHDSAKLVMPASNMKLHTLAVAAERLGWDFRYETRLEATGDVDAKTGVGALHGDLVVVGSGDPSIVSLDFLPAPVFDEWAAAVHAAGIREVDGRIIGDDRAFANEPLGAGWAWDYLDAGYAAPSGALSYNENTIAVRVRPGALAGDPAQVEVSPPGHGLEIVNDATTAAAGATARIELLRPEGQTRLTIRGTIAAGANPVTRTTTIEKPTEFFVDAFRLALESHGVHVKGGAAAIGDLPHPPSDQGRRLIASRRSQPLSMLAGYFMKVSQNFYAETLLKTIGHAAGRAGSAAEGRRIARDTLAAWGIPAEAFVMQDGSGLSRYDYTTADTVVTLLGHVWRDETLRGPFVAALPVGGHDGTLDTRMRGTALDGRVEAKTGSIANVRALSGFLETKSGEHVVFSILVNNFTAPSAQIDALVERALATVVAER